MRRLVVILFVAIVVVGMAVGVAGARSESAPKLYSQVVDSSSEDRFEADESWGESSYARDVYGESYRFARPDGDGTLARFKVEIPETAKYAVYGRWPDIEGLNESAPVGVETSSGVEWKRMDERQDGGRWVRIGVFEMEEGDDYYVRFSPETDGEGYVAADAVKVVQVSPGETSSEKLSESAASKKLSESKRSAGGPTGEDVIKEARKYLGVRYRLGGASRSGIDCSGLTMMVYRKFGVSLPQWDDKQYRYGAQVRGEPKVGDLVFFDEYGKGISHVGIYSGNGKLIHASDYFGRVTESEMKYIKGYKGARRLL